MRVIAGVDIGNSTTEVCIGSIDYFGELSFLAGASCSTTGTKGTIANIHSVKTALTKAVAAAGLTLQDLMLVRLNEAAPVIGDTAMETLTETIITDSSMIGHNPSTPAGYGQAVGRLLSVEKLERMGITPPISGKSVDRPGNTAAVLEDSAENEGTQDVHSEFFEKELRDQDYILTVPRKYTYEDTARLVNTCSGRVRIRGLILQADEAVLVWNRLEHKLPVIDEVAQIEKLPDGELAAIEVAAAGQSVRMLSNPYGIATLLGLNAEQTKQVTPIAKSLIGKRSAVVIKTPNGNIRENVLPAGEIYLHAERDTAVNLDEGAEKIMRAVSDAGVITDIDGQPDTNVGNMFARIRRGMAELDEQRSDDVHITDILAVDTLAPVRISGALAGETCLEKAVGVAAMVKTQQLPMKKIAERLQQELGVEVMVAGVEAVMASLGALTTPGTKLPLAVLDMGGGSTDAAVISENGKVAITHQAGAGELVSMLIQIELGLGDRHVAEQIKRYPLAKVESLFHMRLEDGRMNFVEESIEPQFYGRVVLLTESGLVRIEEDIPMEKIVQVRREAKKKVFVTNALRALRQVAPGHDIRNIENVVLVGGSAEDFEIPEILMEEFAQYRIVCGRGNIRRTEGPRGAVATGLVLSYLG